MIEWDLDTMDLSEIHGLDKSQIDDLLESTVVAVTKKFKKHWWDVAKVELGSTRGIYQRAIQMGSRGRFTGVVYLNPAERLANMIEMGASSFDMKTGFLSSPKVKMGKSGPYMTIGFRFAGAGSVGESEGFAGVMPKEINDEVSSAPEKPLPLSSIGSKHRMPKSQALRKRMKTLKSQVGSLPSGQQTSKYEGIKRNAKGSGYVNFRRVSLNSDPSAFTHPGFKARDLSTKAEDRLDIEGILTMTINKFLSSI